MKTEVVQSLTATFEGHAQLTKGGVEYWLARDIQYFLGYTEWRKFGHVVTKAKTACEISDLTPRDHVVDVNKMVQIGLGVEREIEVSNLTRYAGSCLARSSAITATC